MFSKTSDMRLTPLPIFIIALAAFSNCEDKKRILLNDADFIQQMEEKLQTLTQQVASLSTAQGSGATYVIWGRSTCPSNSSELVYSGYAGSSLYSDIGAATNNLCMASDPQWQIGNKIQPYDTGPRIYGVQYYVPGETHVQYYDDVRCAVCRSHHFSVIMIPGRRSCYDGWTLEYTGYIAAGQRNTNAGNQFLCINDPPEAVAGGSANNGGGWLEPATCHCGSLPCPPYVENKIVVCVVCSK